MYVDALLMMSNAQAVTSSAASSSVIDTLAAADAYGSLAWVHVAVQTAVTADGAATVQFEIQTSADEAFGSYDTLAITGAIGKATLVAGYRPLSFQLPLGVKRYLRAYYTVATGPLTAGKFDCMIVADENARIGA